eukprot:778547-Rhodomonas_salina.1
MLQLLQPLQQQNYNELVQKHEQHKRNAAAQTARGNERPLRSRDNHIHSTHNDESVNPSSGTRV